MRLLIAYDGSDGAKAAIDDLLRGGLPEIAVAAVLSVIDGRAVPGEEAGEAAQGADPDPQAPGRTELCRAIAEEGAERLRTRFPRWGVTAEVCVGAPAWKIIERAEAGGVDLIVVGSRGHGEFKRLLFGSVAHHVVTQARRPVRIGRPWQGAERAEDRPLRIVVGDDGSPDARAAVDSVASRRWPAGTRILVATYETGVQATLSTWSPSTIWGGDPVVLDPAAAAERPAIRVAAGAAELMKARCPGVSVSTLVRPGDPKYGLLDMAETWEGAGADGVFVGATGVRGIARFLVGSVSTTVALSAPCSVEVVHRP